MRKYIVVLLAMVMVGCSTTPNNEDQRMKADARAEHKAWKEWCLDNGGVVYENDLGDRACWATGAFRRTLTR